MTSSMTSPEKMNNNFMVSRTNKNKWQSAGGVQPRDYYLSYNKAQCNFKIANIHSKVIFVQANIHTQFACTDVRNEKFMWPSQYLTLKLYFKGSSDRWFLDPVKQLLILTRNFFVWAVKCYIAVKCASPCRSCFE